MKKKIVVVFALVMVALLAVCACSSPSQEAAEKSAAAEESSAAPAASEEAAAPADDTADEGAAEASGDGGSYKIGIIPMSLNDTFQVLMSNSAKMRAEELGMEAVIQGSTAHTDAEVQLQYIETMIANDYDGIIIAPSATEGLLTAIKKCQDNDVALINFDAMLNPELLESNGLDPVPHYGSDNYEGGIKAGKFAKENFPEGTKTAILLGIEGHDATITRTQGFKDGSEGTMDIVAEQTADFDVEKGYTATQNILTGNPDLELIFANSTGMGIGAARAVEEAGMLDQVKIINFDGIPEGLALVQEGKIAADVAQDGIAMGTKSAEAIFDLLQGKEIEMKVDTGTVLVTSDDVEEYLAYMEPYL
ncbi:MAG: sugar ABC transporter substrate-binding protein [Christensenellaceae bacterium]|jgi:ribose transport system substrate-binding protein